VISIQYYCATKYFELLVLPLLSKHSNTLSLQEIGFMQTAVPVSATLHWGRHVDYSFVQF